MFDSLRTHVANYYEAETATETAYIEHGRTNADNPDCTLRRYSTDSKWNLYQSGAITREAAVKFATARAHKQIAKEAVKCLSKLDAAQEAERLDMITIVVEWRKSYTWGWNPTATVWAGGMTTTGRASGCGYDKESAAVADALNQNPAILKELYLLKQKNMSAGISDTSNNTCTGIDNRRVCGYGAGHTVLPYFEGGVGVDCFFHILEDCGFKTSARRTLKTTFYTLTREAVTK